MVRKGEKFKLESLTMVEASLAMVDGTRRERRGRSGVEKKGW